MKSITMIELRQRMGAIGYEIREHGETFELCYQGKPFALIKPIDDTTVIGPDGTIKGEKPLTMGLDLGGEYGSLGDLPQVPCALCHTRHWPRFLRAYVTTDPRPFGCGAWQ